MEPPDTETPTVTIGGREVSHLVAALIAQESDRLGILPGQVGDVVIPDPAPTHVMISGYSLSIDQRGNRGLRGRQRAPSGPRHPRHCARARRGSGPEGTHPRDNAPP